MEGFYNDSLAPGAAGLRSWPRVVVTFETGIVAAAIGIAVYFAWWTEPDWRIAALVTAIVAALGAWSRNALVGLVAFLCLGFAWSAFSTALTDPNPVQYERRMTVEGHVVDVDRGGRMRRLTIDVASVSPVPDSGMPERVRVRVGKTFPDLAVGEGLRVDAVIGPLPGPAVPNGYDPGRRAFFDGLAGTGFAIAPPEPYQPELSRLNRASNILQRMRRRIAARVMNVAPEQTAGLQAALLTGLRDDIPDAQTDALRASGLAHILAISGLHMGMVAFGVFAFATAGLALLPQAAARDMRKPAALIGIAAATAYLGLSGASVATQRTYVMVVIAFLAILLDRRALSLRSVAVAAAITLAIRPEALMSVGFQMSFAAVAALVVVYREWAQRWPRQKAIGLRDRIGAFYGSLAGTSVIAGLATGGFALFHFGRIARYGLLGNLAAMAVFPLVMLCGIVALVVMPLGWEALPLAAMSALLRIMLAIAEWVAGLPGAVGTVKASHPAALALYGLGFTAACFATRRSLIAGSALVIIAAIVWIYSPSATLRINPDGRVSVLTASGGQTSSTRADRYGRDMFSRGVGAGEVTWTSYRDDFANCDALACRFEVDGHWISVVEEASEVAEACSDSALVILPGREAGVVSRRKCDAILLDGRALQRMGGAHVETGRTLKVRPVDSERRSRRPWGR